MITWLKNSSFSFLGSGILCQGEEYMTITGCLGILPMGALA